MGRLFIVSHLGIWKGKAYIDELRNWSSGSVQSSWTVKKQIQYCINYYPVYVCLVASKYGKMYHVKTLWVTLVQLGCVSKISRRKRKLNMHWHASWPKCFSISSFAIVFRAFMDRITLYVYNIKSSVQNNIPVMPWLHDDWMKFDQIF